METARASCCFSDVPSSVQPPACPQHVADTGLALFVAHRTCVSRASFPRLSTSPFAVLSCPEPVLPPLPRSELRLQAEVAKISGGVKKNLSDCDQDDPRHPGHWHYSLGYFFAGMEFGHPSKTKLKPDVLIASGART